ncbi:RNA polymerase sigma factor SigJ [Nocardia sp. CDC159]|uniref:RNA polymerase sigma factor SigJ n=1 Tax=Nocardia pulmonis TaxID=2951408 RepID=A0A9X2IVQ7_9NOCA|nr:MULTISPECIES: RNA polymerase sigma factor SigJ [Nocardia]MCM6773483.1 RNA polymerase sigma factor SigJ [Nocardia pulmonis]MCM6786370.1 RNA polymerase sigma factor SigJ [Nocardia sp. CDC159]
MTEQRPDEIDQTELARRFEEHRQYLRRLAYSTLGSLSDADDVVQEAWLRLQRWHENRSPGMEIDNLRAWLSTVVGRLALDQLGSARARREQYVGEWLPEPEVSGWNDDPADRITQDERVTTALLVVLESLSPAERTAFVLQEVFGMSGPEVAEVVGRTPAAVRQLASRARKRVEEGTPRFPASRDEHAKAVSAFAMAWRSGDLSALLGVLDDKVTLTADGGGKVPAIRKPISGAELVAKVLLGWYRAGNGVWGRFVSVNGAPGLIVFDGQHVGVWSFIIENDRITGINVVRNPDKLRDLPAAEPDWYM